MVESTLVDRCYQCRRVEIYNQTKILVRKFQRCKVLLLLKPDKLFHVAITDKYKYFAKIDIHITDDS